VYVSASWAQSTIYLGWPGRAFWLDVDLTYSVVYHAGLWFYMSIDFVLSDRIVIIIVKTCLGSLHY
jgi:hypothetical protein